MLHVLELVGLDGVSAGGEDTLESADGTAEGSCGDVVVCVACVDLASPALATQEARDPPLRMWPQGRMQRCSRGCWF